MKNDILTIKNLFRGILARVINFLKFVVNI